MNPSSISANVLADSVSRTGQRLTTFQITAHRFILAEINTHRVFSRSFRSSRAVPTQKLIEEVRTNPAMPVRWQADQPGMQGGSDLTEEADKDVRLEWLCAADNAADSADFLNKQGLLSKGIVNRLLEPFLYVHGVITATEWSNFFALRDHADAQPEFRELARAMRAAMDASKPRYLEDHEWHLPYVTEEDKEYDPDTERLCRISAARCARVSYKLFDGSATSWEKDYELSSKLLSNGHMSPFEHQGCADPNGKAFQGNFRGFTQYRKLLEIDAATAIVLKEHFDLA